MTASPDLTPQQEAVRRLLAEARHDEPTPPEIVDRLDVTLTELTVDRGAASTAPVIELGARRRRLASYGVLAAAAVVIAGVALGEALPRGNDVETSADSSASPLSEKPHDDSDNNRSGASRDAPESLTESQAKKSYVPPATELPEIGLDVDLAESLTDLRSRSGFSSLAPGAAVAPCEVGATAQGRRVPVQVDGQPGLVLFGVPQGARQQAEVFVCGESEPVRRLSLPAP